MFLDLPEPWRALDVAARALRPGGVLTCYVPTALQLKDTCEALQRSAHFGQIESFETLLRHWQVKGMSVRPVHRMVAHSAFIIVSRRLSDAAPAATAEERQSFAAAPTGVEDDSIGAPDDSDE